LNIRKSTIDARLARVYGALAPETPIAMGPLLPPIRQPCMSLRRPFRGDNPNPNPTRKLNDQFCEAMYPDSQMLGVE
jgi:hypothetical protein